MPLYGKPRFLAVPLGVAVNQARCSGPDRDTILPIAYRLNEALSTRFSRREGNQIRAIPSLDNGAPQIRISPDLTALARAGVTVRELASTVDVFNDGANVIQILFRAN